MIQGMASKYDPLTRHLRKSSHDRLKMSFLEIEQVLGFPLPKSARTYDAWWLDRSPGTTHSHAKAWLDGGRQVENVDRNAAVVTFSAVLTKSSSRSSPNAR